MDNVEGHCVCRRPREETKEEDVNLCDSHASQAWSAPVHHCVCCFRRNPLQSNGEEVR